MESVWSMRLRKTCPKCGAVVQCMRRGRFAIVAMPLHVKGGHVAVMIVSLRKLPNAEGLHFSAFHISMFQCDTWKQNNDAKTTILFIPLSHMYSLLYLLLR